MPHRKALSSALLSPRPVGSGDVMWCASPDAPYPAISQYMRAPLALACSKDSKMSTPPPSAMTKPDRSASNGLLAALGLPTAEAEAWVGGERGEGGGEGGGR